MATISTKATNTKSTNTDKELNIAEFMQVAEERKEVQQIRGQYLDMLNKAFQRDKVSLGLCVLSLVIFLVSIAIVIMNYVVLIMMA